MPSKKPTQKNSHITYHDVEQGSDAWHEAREGKFTGSNAYKLLSSFGAGSHAFSEASSFTGNYHTKRGHILEDEAVELYQDITGCKVDHIGYVTNDKYQNCLYSPDGYTEKKVIEIKCFSPKKHLELITSPKLEVLAQCHFGQLILEKSSTDLIAYCPKPKDWDESKNGEWPIPIEKMLVIIPIKRDVDVQNNFKDIIRKYNENRRNQ